MRRSGFGLVVVVQIVPTLKYSRWITERMDEMERMAGAGQVAYFSSKTNQETRDKDMGERETW